MFPEQAHLIRWLIMVMGPVSFYGGYRKEQEKYPLLNRKS